MSRIASTAYSSSSSSLSTASWRRHGGPISRIADHRSYKVVMHSFLLHRTQTCNASTAVNTYGSGKGERQQVLIQVCASSMHTWIQMIIIRLIISRDLYSLLCKFGTFAAIQGSAISYLPKYLEAKYAIKAYNIEVMDKTKKEKAAAGGKKGTGKKRWCSTLCIASACVDSISIHHRERLRSLFFPFWFSVWFCPAWTALTQLCGTPRHRWYRLMNDRMCLLIRDYD